MQHACCVYGTHCLYLEKKTKSVYLRLHFEPQIARVPPMEGSLFPVFLELWRFQKSNLSFQIPTYDQTHIFAYHTDLKIKFTPLKCKN